MSCTRYQPPNPSDGSFDEKKVHQYVRAHTALGGGNMALFGTGCLHTWARTLEELYSRFTDTRDIDRKRLFDDSANRFACIYHKTDCGARVFCAISLGFVLLEASFAFQTTVSALFDLSNFLDGITTSSTNNNN